MRRRVVALVGAAAVVAALAVPAGAAQPAHTPPQGPAKVAFAADFPALVDHEWNFALGGFGGVDGGTPLTHVPVIFVHGNTVDAADWYPVRDAFRAAGWTDQELWGLSYNGLGGNSGTALMTTNPDGAAEHAEMGWDGQVRITNNEVNVPDLYDFILAVRTYTGSDRFVLVTHSLGVTLARRTLKVHPELRGDLVAFVGIAGGNHGTSLCPPGSEGNLVSCNEVAAGSPWLADLNGGDGADETYGPAAWLTVYDGSGVADPAFLGPTYADSPQLKGADNREFAPTYHNDLRVDPDIVEAYRGFIAEAEAAAGSPSPADAGAGSGPSSHTGEGDASTVDAPKFLGRIPGAFHPASVALDAATPVPTAGGTSVGTDAATGTTPGLVAIPAAASGGRRQGPKSPAVNAAFGALLTLGIALIAIDRRRRVSLAAAAS